MWRFALALCLATAVAHANGRPPLTNGVFFQANDPHALYVRTTFGLLISKDDGCTFHWVCENNIGYGGPFDPKYAIANDGTIFATTFMGLRVSRDGACSFQTAAGGLPAVWIDAIDIGPTGDVWVGTAESGAPNDVFASTDNGMTFHSKGMLSPTIWWKSVKVAPSNAKRVYITGYQIAGAMADGGQMPPTPHLLRTDNSGTSWTPSPLTGVMVNATPVLLVAAIDPSNPDVVYVTSVGANNMGDRLYRSSDGGMTLTEVLATTDPISGVVIRDAQNVVVATMLGGSFQSTNGGTSFAPMATPPQLGCIGQSPAGKLYGCGANWDPDFKAVALSPDAGASWQKVWRFVELAGPVPGCAAGTAEHDACELQQWPVLKEQFGATGPSCGAPADSIVPPPPPGKKGCCDAGSGPPIVVVLAVLGLYFRRPRQLG